MGLSIMVKLLGSKVVIGTTMKQEKQKFKYFSNNLPKVSVLCDFMFYSTVGAPFFLYYRYPTVIVSTTLTRFRFGNSKSGQRSLQE